MLTLTGAYFITSFSLVSYFYSVNSGVLVGVNETVVEIL